MYRPEWASHERMILDAAQWVKDNNPGAWNELKVPGQKSRRYINLVSMRLIEMGIPAGVNLKRGGPDVSIDVLALPNASGCRDATGTYPGLELRDIVNGAEGPHPTLVFGDATPATIAADVPGGWRAGSISAEVPVPQPPAVAFPPRNETMAAFEAINIHYHEKGRQTRTLTEPELYIDNEGIAVWLQQYLLYRVNGQTHSAAVSRVLADINAAWS